MHRDEELKGRKIRITTHGYSELAPNIKGEDFHDGIIISILHDSETKSQSLILVDFGNVLPLRSGMKKSGILKTRYMILRNRWKDFPFSIIMDGYWVEVDPYLVDFDIAMDIMKPIDLSNQNLIRLSTQACYLTPSGRDPYMQRWYDCKVRAITLSECDSNKISNNKECKDELSVKMPDGIEFHGYANRSDWDRQSNTIQKLEVILTNCMILRRSSDSGIETYIKEINAKSQPNSYKINGIVNALWWPTDHIFSIMINDLILTVTNFLENKQPIERISIGDHIELVGILQFSKY